MDQDKIKALLHQAEENSKTEAENWKPQNRCLVKLMCNRYDGKTDALVVTKPKPCIFYEKDFEYDSDVCKHSRFYECTCKKAITLFMRYYRAGLKEGEIKNSTEAIQQLINIIREKKYSPRTVEAYSKLRL